jgi:hypothetical protein
MLIDTLLKGSLVLTTLLFSVGCDSFHQTNRERNRIPSWVFEGWGCSPGPDRHQQPNYRCPEKDYLFMLFGVTTQSSNNGTANLPSIEDRCRVAALQAARESSLLTCAFFEIGEDFECPVFAQTPWYRKQFTEIGVYNCCPMDDKTGRCTDSVTREQETQCMCVGYMRFIGGSSAFEKLLLRLEK